MNRSFKINLTFFNILIVLTLLPFIFSCSSGIEKAQKSAESAKEEVTKTGTYNFFPGTYKRALKLMKKAGKKTEKKEIEKAQRFYGIARKKFLEINSNGADKKEHLESSIKSILSEIDGAKENAKNSLATVSDSCVGDIAGKALGKSSSAKTIVLKYFDKLKEKAQKKFGQAEEQITKASALEGDENLKKKNKKLKSILDTYTSLSQISDEICSKTESLVQKSLKKKTKSNKVKK